LKGGPGTKAISPLVGLSEKKWGVGKKGNVFGMGDRLGGTAKTGRCPNADAYTLKNKKAWGVRTKSLPKMTRRSKGKVTKKKKK